MQVLLIQSASEHLENWRYREAQCFRRAFDRLGVIADVWGKGYPSFVVPFLSYARNFDVVLVLENYGSEWLPSLKGFQGKKLLWIIDSHKVADEIALYSQANDIDVNLVAWKNHLDKFPNSRWFPPCYPADLCLPMRTAIKRHDVGFCGSRGNRGQWLDDLTRDVGLKQDIFVLGDSMVTKINSYRIHFNRNETADVLAFRTFETMGCGVMLLTDRSGNVAELFREGYHLALYDSYEDCMAKIRYYMGHAEEREKIAWAGQKEVFLKHTYDRRALEILSILNGPVGPFCGGQEIQT